MNEQEKRQQRETHLVWATQLLASAQLKGWHGTMSFKIEAGTIRRVVLEESKLPPESGSPRNQ